MLVAVFSGCSGKPKEVAGGKWALWFAAMVVWSATAVSAVALKPDGAAGFFVTPDAPAVLRWRVEDGNLAGNSTYVVRDYWGKQVARGKAQIGSDGRIEIPVKLPRGFFEVELAATKQRFGIVSLPEFVGEADPFFAIDSAMSWLVQDDAVRRELIEGLVRSGIGMSRERVRWGQINPAEGQWDWRTACRYEELRRRCAARGVEVLEMFHDAPEWTGRITRYPDNLAKTARSWREIAKRWRPTWGAMEVWNEPDIFFGGDLPADQYTPLLHTFAYTFAAAKIDAPLVGGVFAHDKRKYLDTAAACGMLDSVDVVSFHTYGQALQLEALVGRYRDWLGAHGRETMPLWLTECGRPWKRGPARPPVEQDAVSALDITMKGVESRACGIARYFAFVYPYYEERDNNFGMMGKRATPLRSMAAYTQLVRALAGKRYLGDLTVGTTLQRARAFGDDREVVAVLYSGAPDRKATLKLDAPARRLEGIDGRPLQLGADRVAPIPDGLLYAWFDRDAVMGLLETDTPAMTLHKMSLGAPPKRRGALERPPSPIVLRYQFDAAITTGTSEGYRFKTGVADAPLTIRVFNLSENVCAVSLTLSLSPTSARLIGPAVQTVNAPANGYVDATWRVNLGDAIASHGAAIATVSATSQAEGRIAPLELNLTGSPDFAKLMERFKGKLPLPIAKQSAWTPSIVPDGRMTMTVTPEGHWRLNATFAEGDPWVYPRFELPGGVDLSKATGLAIRARCEGRAIVRVFCWEDGGVGYLTPSSIVPADGEWHSAVVRFADLTLSTANAPDPNGRLDLSQVRHLSIGMNGKAKRNVLEVSAMYVINEKVD